MDSVTQFVLGASVAGAVFAGRPQARRAAVWGGVVATLPDLDVLIDHGDAVQNMIHHRAESHALFWMTLATPLLAWGIAALHRDRAAFGRWCLAVWLALVTHALLDALTIYGTRLLLPFTATPFAVGCLFVIDPLYTLPLLVGSAARVSSRGPRGAAWNRAGLWLSCAYAVWSLAAQQLAIAAGQRAIDTQGLAAHRLVVTPAPLQTVLWRVLAVGDERAYEAFWSPFDGGRPLVFTAIDRGAALAPLLRDVPAARALVAFSGDCTKVERDGDALRVTDLRMGQDPHYVFSFVVAHTGPGDAVAPVAAPVRSGARIDVGRGLAWLWPRMWGADLPSPR